MFPCPVCSKPNASGQCQRCGADLEVLHKLRIRAENHVLRARQLLKMGMIREAREQAEASWRIKPTCGAAECLIASCGAQRDFVGAKVWLEKLGSLEDGITVSPLR
jgi:hypothetical protein